MGDEERKTVFLIFLNVLCFSVLCIFFFIFISFRGSDCVDKNYYFSNYIQCVFKSFKRFVVWNRFLNFKRFHPIARLRIEGQQCFYESGLWRKVNFVQQNQLMMRGELQCLQRLGLFICLSSDCGEKWLSDVRVEL